MQFNSNNKQKTRVKRVIEVYSRMLLNNNIDWIKLKNIYSRQIKDEYAEYNVKKIVRQRSVIPMITEKLIELTTEHGISAENSLKLRKKVLNQAIKKEDYTNANKALDSFDEKLDLKPQKQQIKTTEEYIFNRHLPSGEKQQLKARQTKELEGDKEDNEQNS